VGRILRIAKGGFANRNRRDPFSPVSTRLAGSFIGMNARTRLVCPFREVDGIKGGFDGISVHVPLLGAYRGGS
jgi:hypothetical protein